MSDLDLTPIKARLNAATPGPWAVIDDLAVTAAPDVGGDDACLSIVFPAIVEFTPSAADADFIAHAPTDIAALVAEVESLRENPRDEHHTMAELYDYRLAYNAAAFNEWADSGMYDVHKSLRHSDGRLCFGGGWFVVVAQLPTGQISNHYHLENILSDFGGVA